MKSWSITQTISRKFLLSFGLLWLIGCGVGVLIVTMKTNDLFDSEIESVANTLASLDPPQACLADTGTSCRFERSVLSGERGENLTYQVRAADGRLLHRSALAPEQPYPVPVKAGFQRHGSTQFFTAFYPDGKSAIQVAGGAGERVETIGWLLVSLLVPMGGLMILGSILIRRSAQQATKPIAEVVDQLLTRSGKYLEPLPEGNAPEELLPVVSGINRMMSRLKAALEQERSFSANCAHELRNPLAAATAQAELMIEEHNVERAKSQVSALQEFSHKLERLLQLSRAEAGVGMTATVTDLARTVKFIIEGYGRTLPNAEQLAYVPGPSPPYPISLDVNATGILLKNLIENALKHGAPNSLVVVTVEEGPSVRVTNHGEVVPKAMLARLTDRFERGLRSGPGEGLGLSIVNQIVRQSGGSLRVRSPASNQSDGFEVQVVFARPPEESHRL